MIQIYFRADPAGRRQKATRNVMLPLDCSLFLCHCWFRVQTKKLVKVTKDEYSPSKALAMCRLEKRFDTRYYPYFGTKIRSFWVLLNVLYENP